MKRERKYVTLIAGGLILITIALVCTFAVSSGWSGTGGGVEVEDCDADDIKERDSDCGFINPVKTTKPASVKTPTKQQQPSVKKFK